MSSLVDIHQAVHGYREGHRLLTASLELDRESEREMVTLSDLSGQTLPPEFSEYLTGYPLPEMGLYVLAKTWYAFDMPRPGCVWTHSLLIPFSLLASIPSLQVLLGYFKEPKEETLSSYNLPMAFELDSANAAELHSTYDFKSSVGDVLSNLYRLPKSPIAVPVERPDMVEELYLAIWSQQWPRLRRTFSFCTGSIGPRRVMSHWFDLQAMPKKSVEDFERLTKDVVVAQLGTPPNLRLLDAWAQHAESALGSTDSELQTFLFEYGAEANGGRKDFEALTRLFVALFKDEVFPRQMDSHFKRLFPTKSDGKKFKTNYLNGDLGSELIRMPQSRLKTLLGPMGELFGTSEFDVERVVIDAWRRDPNAVMDTIELSNKEANGFSDQIATQVAHAIATNVSIPGLMFQAISSLAKHHPAILMDQSLVSKEQRAELFLSYLCDSEATPSNRDLIVGVLIREEEYRLLRDVLAQRPEWFAPSITSTIELNLEHGVTIPDHEIAQWVKSAPKHFGELFERVAEKQSFPKKSSDFVCGLLLVLESEGLQTSINENNQLFFTELLESFALDVSDKCKSVIVAIYLSSVRKSSTAGANVSSYAFPILYRLVKRKLYTADDWRKLARYLGEERVWTIWDWSIRNEQSWDKCRQLLEGYIERYLVNSWPEDIFEDMLERDRELATFIELTSLYRHRYLKFLRRVS